MHKKSIKIRIMKFQNKLSAKINFDFKKGNQQLMLTSLKIHISMKI